MSGITWIDMLGKMNELTLFSRTIIRRTKKENELCSQQIGLLSLITIHEEEMTPINISKAMGLNKTVVSRLIDSLNKNGYVEKHPSLNDKRSYSICITDKGKEKMSEIYGYYLAPIYELRKKMGDDDFLKLFSYIEEANKKMSETIMEE